MRPGGCHCLPGSGLEKKGQKRVGLEHVAQSQELMTGQPTQLQAGGNRGRRLDINFNHRGTHIFSRPIFIQSSACGLSASAPLPFSLPLVTFLLGMSKCKMQKPRQGTQPKGQLWLVAQAVLSQRHPGQSKAKAGEGRGLGAPSAADEASSVQEAEERPEGVGEHSDGWSLMGMDGTGCSAGRFSIHSAMASFMRGASAGQKNSGRGCG